MPEKSGWLSQHLFVPAQTASSFFLYCGIALVIFVLLFALLHRLPPAGKKWLTIVCTFLAGLYFTFNYLLDPNSPVKWISTLGTPLAASVQPVADYVLYIIVWTLGLGIISLLIVHGRRMVGARPGWQYSLAFFLAFFGLMIAGFATRGGTLEQAPAGALFAYRSLFNGLLLNLDAAMFALLAFYISSAAYRAFRIRTVEAGLLMCSALVVMLGVVEVGVWLTHGLPESLSFLRLEQISQWVLMWVNMPAQKAVGIGVAIGALAMAMRIWLSLERGAFFSQE